MVSAHGEFIKINFDGSFLTMGGAPRVGIIVRNAQGMLLWEAIMPLKLESASFA